jgi:hypothetical protein
MEALLMIVLAVVLVLAGSAATLMIAVLLPVSSMERAQHNGRFAGLGTGERKRGGGSGGRVRQTAMGAVPALQLL